MSRCYVWMWTCEAWSPVWPGWEVVAPLRGGLPRERCQVTGWCPQQRLALLSWDPSNEFSQEGCHGRAHPPLPALASCLGPTPIIHPTVMWWLYLHVASQRDPPQSQLHAVWTSRLQTCELNKPLFSIKCSALDISLAQHHMDKYTCTEEALRLENKNLTNLPTWYLVWNTLPKIS